MKRKLIFFIAAMLICSSISAQNHYTFNTHDYQLNMGIVAQIKINGVEQTSNNIELGAFNGESIRGSQRIGQYGSAGYYRVVIQIYGDPAETNYEVTFKIYNHDTGEELDNCNITYLGEPYVVRWVGPSAVGTNKKPVVLDFVTTQTFTKEIAAYTENGGYYLIASPIDNANPAEVDGMTTGTFDLYWFDHTQDLEWRNYKQGDGFNLVSGMGYLYANSQDVTLTFTGTPIESDTYEVSLVKDDESENFSGWNLVGNPFAQTAYISKPFYTMNGNGSEVIAGTGNSIAAMEGIFVVADTDGETMTFSTTNPNAKNSMVALNLSNNCNIIDRVIVHFGEDLTLPKFQLRSNSTKVYIPMDNNEYAVVHSEGMGELPVNFIAEKNGIYTLSFNTTEVEFSYLHLIDNLTGTDVNLLENPCYSFEAKTTDYASRFKIVFIVTGNEASTGSADFAFFSNSKLVVVNEGQATLQIVDLTGRIVKSETINGCANVDVNVTPGVYMLRLMNSNDIKTMKIVVK